MQKVRDARIVATGCVIEGFPSNFKLDLGRIQH